MCLLDISSMFTCVPLEQTPMYSIMAVCQTHILETVFIELMTFATMWNLALIR